MKAHFSRWLATTAAALSLATPVLAAEPFKIGYLRVMDDAQAIAAYEGGYYEKHGLDVELIEFTSGTDLIKAIVGGQLDTGVLGFTNAASWSSRGADLRVVGGAQDGFHAIVVRENTGIESVEDLKGRTLASQKEGSTADTVLRGVVFPNAGLEDGDVQVMGVSPQVAVQSLVGERVDAAFLFEPQATLAQLIAPVKQIYEIGEVWPFPCMVVITSGEVLESKKDLVWKSLDAQREAIDLLENHPARAAELIADYFIADPTVKTRNQGEIPREQVIRDAIISQNFTAKLTQANLDRMQEIADIMQERGALKTRDGEPFDVASIVDLSWQEARGL